MTTSERGIPERPERATRQHIVLWEVISGSLGSRWPQEAQALLEESLLPHVDQMVKLCQGKWQDIRLLEVIESAGEKLIESRTKIKQQLDAAFAISPHSTAIAFNNALRLTFAMIPTTAQTFGEFQTLRDRRKRYPGVPAERGRTKNTISRRPGPSLRTY